MESEKVVPTERIFTANFLWLCFASFGAFGSFYLLLASLPVYIKNLGVPESEVGFVLGAFSITAVIVRPFAGASADQRGKKGLMLGGIVIMLATSILYQLAQNVPILTALRVLHGLGWGTFSTSSAALVADVIPVRRRGEAMGYYGVFSNVAMAAGPALGSAVSSAMGFSPLFWISAGVAAVGLMSTLGSKEVAVRRPASTAPLRARLFHPRALFPSAVLFCNALSYGSIVSFLPLFAMKQQLGNPGLFFTVYALVLIVARGPVGRLSDKYGRTAVIAPGLIISAASLALLSTATSTVMLLAVASLYAFSFAAIQPTLQAMTVDRVGPAERGSAMGTFSTAMDLGIGLGAFIWGVVIQVIGFNGMYLVSAAAAVVGFAVLVTGASRQRQLARS